MSKSLLPEAVKLLGLEIGEEFNFCGYRKNVMIDEDGYVLEPTDSGEWRRSKNFDLADLFRVPHEIRKLPWKPKCDERYWTFEGYYENTDPNDRNRRWKVVSSTWMGLACEFARLKTGWIYRTKAEAEAALPKIAKELGVEYEL